MRASSTLCSTLMAHHRSAAKTVEVAVGVHDGVRDRIIKSAHLVAKVAQTQPRGDRFKILHARDHANEFDLAAPLIRGTECIAPYVWTKNVQDPAHPPLLEEHLVNLTYQSRNAQDPAICYTSTRSLAANRSHFLQGDLQKR